MSPTKLKMLPTIHLQSEPGYCSSRYLGLLYKCIVGCIFNFVGFIIIREIPCIFDPYNFIINITTGQKLFSFNFLLEIFSLFQNSFGIFSDFQYTYFVFIIDKIYTFFHMDTLNTSQK
jgi:hypothetical protein